MFTNELKPGKLAFDGLCFTSSSAAAERLSDSEMSDSAPPHAFTGTGSGSSYFASGRYSFPKTSYTDAVGVLAGVLYFDTDYY